MDFDVVTTAQEKMNNNRKQKKKAESETQLSTDRNMSRSCLAAWALIS